MVTSKIYDYDCIGVFYLSKQPIAQDYGEIPFRVPLSGSQSLYVTNSWKRKLGVATVKTETLNLNTSGSEKYIQNNAEK